MHYKKQDAAQIAGFCEALERIDPKTVVEIPFLGDCTRGDGKYLTVTVEDAKRIAEIPMANVLMDSKFFEPDTSQEPSGRFHFTQDSLRRISREDSRHAVFFGSLYDPDGAKAEIAVKASPKINLAEIAWYQNLAECGLMTYAPIGYIALEGSQVGYTMTAYNQEVTTLDSYDWRSFSEDEKIGKLELVIDTAIALHKHALLHSDLEFRNVASDDLDDPFIIDPEFMVDISGKFRELEQSRDLRERSRLRQGLVNTMSAEFTGIVKSISDYILPTMKHPPKKSMDKFSFLQEVLYDPYMAKLMQQPGEHILDIIDLYERMYDKKMNDAKNELL